MFRFDIADRLDIPHYHGERFILSRGVPAAHEPLEVEMGWNRAEAGKAQRQVPLTSFAVRLQTPSR